MTAGREPRSSRDTERVRDNLNVLRRTQGNDALQPEPAKKLGGRLR